MVCSETIDVADGPAMADWLTAFDREYPVELLVANAGISDGIGGKGAYELGDVTARRSLSTCSARYIRLRRCCRRSAQGGVDKLP